MSSENLISRLLEGSKKLKISVSKRDDTDLFSFKYDIKPDGKHVLVLESVPDGYDELDSENLDADLSSSAFILSKQMLFSNQTGLLTYLSHIPGTRELVFLPRTEVIIYDVNTNSLTQGNGSEKIFRSVLKESLDAELEKMQIRTFYVDPTKTLFIGREENPVAWEEFRNKFSRYFSLERKRIEPFCLDSLFYRRTN